MRSRLRLPTVAALVLLPGAVASRAARADQTGAETRAPAEPAADTFETLAEAATPAGDVSILLGALLDKCVEGERDLDRARCRASQAHLRRTLPERSLSIVVDDPAAISVSGYDQAIKGIRLGLAACVACTNPIPVGRAAQPFLVTLKKPVETAGPAGKRDDSHDEKAGDRLAAAVEVATTIVGFGSEAEAARWLREVRPRLRATFIFKPAPNEWRSRSARGYTLGLIAGRIVDPCTGDVVLSSPPSRGSGERMANVTCPGSKRAPAVPAAAAATTSSDDEQPQLPMELSRNAISDAMGQIRSQIFACFQRNQVPGTAQLTYEVAGDGLVQAVRLDGGFTGTPTGACVLDAARNARFPRFDGPIQTFDYPFFLRR